MDALLLQVLLWLGLIFFFWFLHDGVSAAEPDADLYAPHPPPPQTPIRPQYDQPEKLFEAIGSYQDARIYRYAIINGLRYQFDHVCPADSAIPLQEGERYVKPGLVYVRDIKSA